MGSELFTAFCFILYPDDETKTHMKALESVKNYSQLWGWKYFFILHDKDKDEDGNIKKPHYHLVVCTERKSPKSIATRLGLSVNYVQGCYNLRGSLRYLIHEDDPLKFQYSSNEVISNTDYIKFKDNLSIIRSDDENEDLLFGLLDEMLDNGEKITYTSVLRCSRKIGLGDFVRKKHQYASKIISDYSIQQYGQLQELDYKMGKKEENAEHLRKKGFMCIDADNTPFGKEN